MFVIRNGNERLVDSMTIEEMRERKKELGYSYEKIAELSGVPVGTVQKVLGGITKAPRYETLQALERVLKSVGYQVRETYSYMVKEAAVPYHVSKKQGEFTLEDYFAIPDDQRVELIDGVIYDMASPTTVHQALGDEINVRFREHIKKNKGKCFTVTAPLDVQLDCDDKTMVQPDVLIICDRGKFQNGRVFGAPDLAVEVLSPSTRKKDLSIKLDKYRNAGVREYWLVDPSKQRVCVYLLEKDEFPTIYTFEQKVPVGIWNNECEVDFAEIYDYIGFLYDGENY